MTDDAAALVDLIGKGYYTDMSMDHRLNLLLDICILYTPRIQD